jgi:hypothetical protein
MKNLRIDLLLALLFVTHFSIPSFGQSNPVQVMGTGWTAQTNSSPAVAGGVNDNGVAQRYVAWRGYNDEIYFAVNNGGTGWGDYQVVGGPGWTAETSAAPALNSYAGPVWLAWKGKNSNNIYFSTWDVETGWTPQQIVQGSGWTALTDTGPALGPTITYPYIAWKEPSGNLIYYTYPVWKQGGVFQGWNTPQAVGGSNWTAGTSATPSFAFDKSISRDLFWKGESGDSIWYSAGTSTGYAIEWGEQSTTKCEASTIAGPAVGTFIVDASWELGIFWTTSNYEVLYYSFYNNEGCGSEVYGATTDVAPAVGSNVAFPGGTSILAWKNAADGTIWFIDPTTLPGLAAP